MSQIKFRQLQIGQSFDFVDPRPRARNSFFKRCTKVSTRLYRDEDGMEHQVGTINVEVFNVTDRDATTLQRLSDVITRVSFE